MCEPGTLSQTPPAETHQLSYLAPPLPPPSLYQTGSLLRIVFVPLFVICVHNYDVAFFSDLFVLLMVMGYAITNGYLASVAMMVAPSMVQSSTQPQ